MKAEHEILARPVNAEFDVTRWRKDFPILRERVHGMPLVYLDNAATTQKPQTVIDAEVPITPGTMPTCTGVSIR